MKLSLSKLRPADSSWTAFLAFVFLTGISMPLARVALVLSLVFTLAQPERRKAFRIYGPTLGWLIYLFLAFVISGLIAACASDVSTLLAQYASVKPRLIQWIPAWRMEMIRSVLDSGTAASASGIWDCLPEFLATPFRRAGTDLFTEPLRGFSKLTKMLWYIAIPVAMAQVDSRSRLLTALRVLVLGCLVTALCVLFCNPLAAGYQMLFPTEYQVQAGTASPFSAFLYECTKALGKVEDVNQWIYTRGRAATFSEALIKLGNMSDAQRLMVAVPVALCLCFENLARKDASRRRDFRRSLWTLLIVLLGLLMTCKRGPILATAVVSAGLLLIRLRLRHTVFVLLATALVAAAIPQVRARFCDLPNEFELRRGGRALMWTIIVPTLHEEHPLGIGFRALSYNKMRSIDNHVEQNQNHVHSVPLQVFVEFGYLGVAAWALWMLLGFRNTAKLACLSRRPSKDCSLPETLAFAAPLAMLSALVLYGMVEYNLADSEIVLLYGIAMGLTNRNLRHCVATPAHRGAEALPDGEAPSLPAPADAAETPSAPSAEG